MGEEVGEGDGVGEIVGLSGSGSGMEWDRELTKEGEREWDRELTKEWEREWDGVGEGVGWSGRENGRGKEMK